MADESSLSTSTGRAAPSLSSQSQPAYGGLRWAIRLTGIVLMLAGVFYLGSVAVALLTDPRSTGLFDVVVSLAALGLGIVVLRIGIDMLRSINGSTISSFAFIFALIFTSILMEILPAMAVFTDHPFLFYLMLFLYFGLVYWVVRFILFHLLLPGKRG